MIFINPGLPVCGRVRSQVLETVKGIVMRGFLLGLGGGSVCTAYCAPVLVLCLLGEGRPAEFLSTRAVPAGKTSGVYLDREVL